MQLKKCTQWHPCSVLALMNVAGGKVPAVAKSQMTRQRPLTTVFYALNILDVSQFSQSFTTPHIHTHRMSFLHICAVLLSSCLHRCLRGEGGEHSLWHQCLPVASLLMSKWQSVSCPQLSEPIQQFYPVNIREHINNTGADGVPLYPAFMPSTPFTLLACHDCSFPCTDGGQGARSRRCNQRRKEQQFQFSALSTNSKNRWILEQKSI